MKFVCMMWEGAGEGLSRLNLPVPVQGECRDLSGQFLVGALQGVGGLGVERLAAGEAVGDEAEQFLVAFARHEGAGVLRGKLDAQLEGGRGELQVHGDACAVHPLHVVEKAGHAPAGGYYNIMVGTARFFQAFAFHAAEGLFAPLGKDGGHGAAFALFYPFVQVDERPTGAPRHLAPDGGFARGHETDEEYFHVGYVMSYELQVTSYKSYAPRLLSLCAAWHL